MKMRALVEAMQNTNQLRFIQANVMSGITVRFAIFALQIMGKLIKISVKNVPVQHNLCLPLLKFCSV